MSEKMGMSIDEAIKAIHKMLAYTDLSVRENLNADMIDACHMAINTMRKYQNIKQIVEHWACCGNSSDSIIAISEVVEDGQE